MFSEFDGKSQKSNPLVHTKKSVMFAEEVEEEKVSREERESVPMYMELDYNRVIKAKSFAVEVDDDSQAELPASDPMLS